MLQVSAEELVGHLRRSVDFGELHLEMADDLRSEEAVARLRRMQQDAFSQHFERMAHQMIGSGDRDGDGRLSEQEYAAAAQVGEHVWGADSAEAEGMTVAPRHADGTRWSSPQTTHETATKQEL